MIKKGGWKKKTRGQKKRHRQKGKKKNGVENNKGIFENQILY